ncbi:MAG: hypothetical protein ABEJ80_05270 [Halarchaeum sp.]
MRRATAAALAGTSLFWRELPAAFGRRLSALVDAALDGALGALIGGAVTVTLADLRSVGVVVDLLLYAYLVATVLPAYLPDTDEGRVLGSRAFVVALSVYALLLGYPVSTVAPELFASSPTTVVAAALDVPLHPISPTEMAVVFVAWGALGWGVLVLASYVTWWRTARIEDRIELYCAVVPTSTPRVDHAAAHRRQPAAVNAVSGFFALAAVAGVLVLVCAAFGLLSGFAVVLFPLPELVLVATALLAALSARLPARARPTRVAARLELDSRLFGVARYVRAGPKGVAATGLVLAGVVFSMGLVFLSMVGLVAGVQLAATADGGRQLGAGPDRVAVYALTVICLLSPPVYGLWYWLRQLSRLPYFLDDWHRRHGDAGRDGRFAADAPPLPTRPPGTLVPPTLLFVPASVALLPAGVRSRSPVLVGGLALALCAFLGWCVRWTYRAPPQHPRTDAWAIPAAVLVQVAWLAAFLRVGRRGGAVGAALIPGVLAVTAVSLFLYATPDLEARLRRRVGRYAASVVGVLLGSGVLLGGSAWAVAGGASFVPAALAGAGGVALALSLLSLLLLRFTTAGDTARSGRRGR